MAVSQRMMLAKTRRMFLNMPERVRTMPEVRPIFLSRGERFCYVLAFHFVFLSNT